VLEADEAAAVEEVQAWAAGLGALHARIAGRLPASSPAGERWPSCAGCWATCAEGAALAVRLAIVLLEGKQLRKQIWIELVVGWPADESDGRCVLGGVRVGWPPGWSGEAGVRR
jgi:hypothetical protein